jgi:hypothetical protein
MSRSNQTEVLEAFFEDFGTSSETVKNVARRMKLSESAVSEAAAAHKKSKVGNPARDRQIRESAELMVDRANAAEAKGLRNASLQELEALSAITFGG